MPRFLLNIIIAVSIIGITAIWARDALISPQKTAAIIAPATEITPTIILDSAVLCQNKYFNFTKGTEWHYQVNLKTKFGKEQTIKNYLLTNTIKESSPSSILIESQIDKGKKNTVTLSCKQSGIYGFSLPFLPQSLSEASPSGSLNILSFLGANRSLRFLPTDDKLVVGNSWQDTIGVTIKHTVISQEQNVLEITSKLDFSALPINPLPAESTPQLKYHLSQGIGVRDFNVSIHLADNNGIDFMVKLVDFKPAPTEASQ